MVSYKQLLDVKLDALDTAVDKWKKVPGAFRQLRQNFNEQVKYPLTNSDWEGEAANSALQRFTKVTRQLTEAAEEAIDVHGVLQSAYTEFKRCQDTLKTYEKNIASDNNLRIDADTGKVTYRASNSKKLSAEEATVQAKNYAEVVSSYNQQINEVLTAATQADELLEYALRLDPNGRGKGFSGDGFQSLKEAGQGRKKALKDLKELREVTSSPQDMTATQLQRANSLMSRHEGDPFFTQKFATGLGPEKSLAFWALAADGPQDGGDRTTALKKMQKTLGVSLATASHADSGVPELDRKMEKWKDGVIRLGPERITSTDPDSGKTRQGPYGFQVMSSLMRHGEYDTDFLTRYGKGFGKGDEHVPGLIEFERKNAGDGDLKKFWSPDGDHPTLNFGKGSDKGLDPMAGYMEALGHNPDAGQRIFHRDGWQSGDAAKPDPDLKYLLTDRAWPDGDPLDSPGQSGGYDELGHALEAATIGRPHDQPELGLHRDRDSANVMDQVVTMVADPANSGFLDDRPGLEDSLARMGAAYIDDIDHGVAGFGGMDSDDEKHARVFGYTGPNGGHIDLDEGTAAAFLRETGSNPTGYEILTAAQQAYTVHAMLAHPEPSNDLATLFRTGAEVQGILNENRGAALEERLDEMKEGKQEEIEKSAEWKKAAISSAVGIASGLAVAPFAAPTGGFGTAIAVPLAIETGAGLADTALGGAVDSEVEKKVEAAKKEIDRMGVGDKGELSALGRKHAGHPVDLYLALHPEISNDWEEKLQDAPQPGWDEGTGLANELR